MSAVVCWVTLTARHYTAVNFNQCVSALTGPFLSCLQNASRNISMQHALHRLTAKGCHYTLSRLLPDDWWVASAP